MSNVDRGSHAYRLGRLMAAARMYLLVPSAATYRELAEVLNEEHAGLDATCGRPGLTPPLPLEEPRCVRCGSTDIRP